MACIIATEKRCGKSIRRIYRTICQSWIYNLHKLYGTSIEEVPALAEVKYGIRPYCPDHGEYSYDRQTSRCLCNVHGNREFSRQKPRVDQKSSFSEFINTLQEVNLVLQQNEDSLIATATVIRKDE
ncbi:hypothetical protein [Novipirellula aureliae]|uniref:hypothetical protein n=1 Tax=Novipirellula aureliae TaxID=2527966 RepID=UPI0018CF145B|nr:hypothetical protein [Novipirellula aureliae]